MLVAVRFLAEHRRLVPSLDADTWDRLEAAASCLLEWNAKINVVSRRVDARGLVEHHYLPSLALLNLPSFRHRFNKPLDVLDAGTGGGFPGLPLAVACPAVSFTLADSRGNKLKVVDECARASAATNVRTVHARVPETIQRDSFDFVLGRAVTALPDFLQTVAPVLRHRANDDDVLLDNGVLYFRGGDFDAELASLGDDGIRPRSIVPLASLFPDDASIGSDKAVVHFATADFKSLSPWPTAGATT